MANSGSQSPSSVESYPPEIPTPCPQPLPSPSYPLSTFKLFQTTPFKMTNKSDIKTTPPHEKIWKMEDKSSEFGSICPNDFLNLISPYSTLNSKEKGLILSKFQKMGGSPLSLLMNKREFTNPHTITQKQIKEIPSERGGMPFKTPSLAEVSSFFKSQTQPSSFQAKPTQNQDMQIPYHQQIEDIEMKTNFPADNPADRNPELVRRFNKTTFHFSDLKFGSNFSPNLKAYSKAGFNPFYKNKALKNCLSNIFREKGDSKNLVHLPNLENRKVLNNEGSFESEEDCLPSPEYKREYLAKQRLLNSLVPFRQRDGTHIFKPSFAVTEEDSPDEELEPIPQKVKVCDNLKVTPIFKIHKNQSMESESISSTNKLDKVEKMQKNLNTLTTKTKEETLTTMLTRKRKTAFKTVHRNQVLDSPTIPCSTKSSDSRDSPLNPESFDSNTSNLSLSNISSNSNSDSHPNPPAHKAHYKKPFITTKHPEHTTPHDPATLKTEENTAHKDPDMNYLPHSTKPKSKLPKDFIKTFSISTISSTPNTDCSHLANTNTNASSNSHHTQSNSQTHISHMGGSVGKLGRNVATLKNLNLNLNLKPGEPMPKSVIVKNGESGECKIFFCPICSDQFTKGQALGGHLAKAHPGSSLTYQKKQIVREERKLDRVKLLMAKKRFFLKKGYDYDTCVLTRDGKNAMKRVMNRGKIKEIQKSISYNEALLFLTNEV